MIDNPPAFPGGNPNRFDGRIAEGMTLRDWFAGQAIGFMVGVAVIAKLEMPTSKFAEDAYAIADAMLTERAKGLKP